MSIFTTLLTLAVVIAAVQCVPSTRKKTTCENKTAYLKCRKGYTISIITARYGRTDHATCPSKKIRTTYCSSRESFGIVKRSCNGRKFCKVRVTNKVFGDPCRGTYKYLSVRYMCKKIASTGISRSITCEKKKSTLSCRRGQVLDIVSANYGRTDPNTCYSRLIKTTHCSSSKSFYKTKTRCQGKRSCRLYSSNSVFGDPCRGTYKYLDVKYRCVAYQKPKTFTKTICESEKVTMICPSSMQLNILYASYGRTDGHTCSRYGMMRDTSCSAPGCVERVRKYCHGHHSCTIKASNSLFGDPCRGTYKYLKLKYQCVY
ncbi:L-rhamnose-binding lectin CSL3-like [Ylistrum balloti]|uniref:L-rhamnose-binding lectin CSL3-like n=1 Tax=Ylistrum balloti TaxID=509963 RepID=UPI002905D378|nr:L-rhamnose-binding lectin CSL3-like [Ylistrum balloti]